MADIDCANNGNLIKTVIVYGLCSSEDKKIRYVGQTTRTLADRLDSHIHPNAYGKKRRVWKWINGVINKGFKVEMITLQSNAIWNTSEMQWIAWFKADGIDLVNGTSGGDGVLGRKKTDAEKLHMSKVMTGKKKSAEHIAKIVFARTGKKLSAEIKQKLSLAKKGKMPKNLAQLHISNKGLVRTEENKKKISNSLKGRMVTSKEQLLKNLCGGSYGLER
jgi:hypothetical protein